MSNSPEQFWSDAPNAPQIPSMLYFGEKAVFGGIFACAILYGIVVALFFRCMAVLLFPANPIKKGIKWALVAHTVAMFAFLTITDAIFLNEESVCYIDRREFPGDDEHPPGPISCWGTQAATTVYYVMFPLNQWLSDGLLLRRCGIIYSMNYWAMAFPCLLYIASVAMGVAYIYLESTMTIRGISFTNIAAPYFSVSLSLNIVLTVMIVTRLILQRRYLRKVIGASDKSSGLYTAIVAMLIESYALYAVAYLLYIVPWALQSWLMNPFSKVVGQVQVIAPYLITLRVANRRALTSEMITSGSGSPGSIHFRRSRGESVDDDESFHDGNLTGLMGVDGEAPGEPSVWTKNAIEEVPS